MNDRYSTHWERPEKSSPRLKLVLNGRSLENILVAEDVPSVRTILMKIAKLEVMLLEN